MTIKQCIICGKDFRSINNLGKKSQCCSWKCRTIHRGKRMMKCGECGKEFAIYRFEVGKRKYCSRKCSDIVTSKRTTVQGPLKNCWKGGRCSRTGYPIIWINGDYVYEHRHVMEKYLGRKLGRLEHVHHINGNRSDNRLKNLIVLTIGEHNKLTAREKKESSHGPRGHINY